MLAVACVTSKDWPPLYLLFSPWKAQKEIHIITSDMSVWSSKRNGLCICFYLSFLRVGAFVEKTKENTHVEQHTQGKTIKKCSPWLQLHHPCYFQAAFQSYNKYRVCLGRLRESLRTLFTYSRHTIHLNEAIKLPWVVLKDHSNNRLHYHINVTFATFVLYIKQCI